jgi:hypothetical protein
MPISLLLFGTMYCPSICLSRLMGCISSCIC